MYVMSGEWPTYAAGGLVCRHELVTQSFSRPEGPGMKPGSQQASPPPRPPVKRGGGGGGGSYVHVRYEV
jgi:hypothetical protein